MFLYAIDTHLGKVDLNLLSDQVCMELLIEGFTDETKSNYQDDSGHFVSITAWSCVGHDSDGVVRDVHFRNNAFGTISLEYVPSSVTEIQIRLCENLTGTVETEKLPRSLVKLVINRTGMRGTLNMRCLPRELIELKAVKSNFSGSLDFLDLPPTLERLSLYENQFEGSISLNKLPPTLESLWLCRNKFTGEVSFAHLPYNLDAVALFKNQLSGNLHIPFQPRIRRFMLMNNRFSGTAVIHSSQNIHNIHLKGNSITTAIDENGIPYEVICDKNGIQRLLRAR